MICPRCKKEIPENSLKCAFCGARIGTLCKDCGTYNIITATTCSNCGKVLLKICPECGAANLPESNICRRCSAALDSESVKTVQERADNIRPVYFASTSSQQKAKSKLTDALLDSSAKVISLTGESGSGKNLVLKYALSELDNNSDLTVMFGTCSQVSQLSPFGYFQDVLLYFFNINNFCADTLLLKKSSMKFFKQDFPDLSTSEIMDILNLIYPENYDKYENIYFNKLKMFSIMKKLFLTIASKTNLLFVADKFEYIDGMSYDFIKELLNDSLIREKSKFLLISSESRPALGMISSNKLTQDNYKDIAIAPFTESQTELFLKQYTDIKFSKDYVNKVFKISSGNPSIIEQLLLVKNDIARFGIKNPVYNNLKSVINIRLQVMKAEAPKAYRMLMALSVLGVKFYPAILENFDNLSVDEYGKTLEYLASTGYITRLSALSYEFKSHEIWKTIISEIKNDDSFEEILNRLYETIKIYKQSSVALLGYIVQKLNNNSQAFEIWTLLMKQASYAGDIGLYIISQKQALKLIENKNDEFCLKVKKNIYTRVGKLIEPIDCNASFDYLQKALMMQNDNDIAEYIEILGYISSCALKSGNYYGTIECIENVLSKIPENMKNERILIKTRLVKPLLKLGNYGQLVNLIETELLNEIEAMINKGKDTHCMNLKNIFNTWVGLYFDYAEALIYQGDCKSFGVINVIYEILDKNKPTDPEFMTRANLLLALANTIKGDINLSDKILEEFLKEDNQDSENPNIISFWNLINILNKFHEKKYTNLYNDLFNAATYANNINDNFTKNMLKTFLAKMLNDNNENKKALEILDEQTAYFAKEKSATGVLLGWYLTAKTKLVTNGTQFALDVATKALDIAQSPNINNYYFMALFNKLLGEIYLAKQDFESSKVYYEKAILIAKQFDLQYLLVLTYLQCAKLYQELALPKSSKRGDYIKQALKMFQLAKNVPIAAEQGYLHKRIKEEFNILTSFCKLNGIILKRENKDS